VRPGNAALAFARSIVPARWRDRLRWAGAVALAATLPLVAWTAHNGLRFDTWELARGGNAIVPFYRAFITDHIVSPENGAQSRRLSEAMREHLLTREPYRSYGVTLDELFEAGSFRVHEDLYLLSDQVFGWEDDYSVLRRAGVEGVRANPGTYARGVARTLWDELAKAQFRVVSSEPESDASGTSEPSTVVVGGYRLPAPSEGEPIPAGQVVWISRLTRASGRSGRHQRSGTSSSTDRRTALASRRSRETSTTSSTRCPTARETHSSHFGSTSSPAGSPGRGCGSRSG
jgi:hypothetical protein